MASSISTLLIVVADLWNPTRFFGEWAVGRGCELGAGRPFGKLLRFGADVGSAVRCALAADRVVPLRSWLSGCGVGKWCLRLAELPGLLIKSSASMASFSRLLWWVGETTIGSATVAGGRGSREMLRVGMAGVLGVLW